MGKSLETLLRGLEVLEVHGPAQITIDTLAYDSRRVEQGGLFVAVHGTRRDGHSFIQEALQRGAVAVVTESPIENHAKATFIRVPSSRTALAELSANFYEHPSRRLTLVGVTGTNGKTSTTLLLESIFRSAGYSAGVIGTLAYRWAGKQRTAPMTTPESLDLQGLFHEMSGDGVTHAVMEVSSHALALGRVGNCAFDAALFTNLSQDHLDFHVTMEEYFESKASLFRNYLFKQDRPSASVVNIDDAYGRRLAQDISANLWSYSISNQEARVWIKHADLTNSGIRATVSGPGEDFKIHSPLLGRLNLYNVLSAVATALSLGVSKEAIADGIRALSHVDGRLQRVEIPPGFGFDVIVDYAHTPDAMEKSLECLREMTGGRLVVVFGCGGDRDRGKRPLMGGVAARLGDLVILTSDNPRTEVPGQIIEEIEPGVVDGKVAFVEADDRSRPEKGYTVEVDRRRAIELALRWARPGDMVFIGGKGHETYQIIGTRTFPFDDRLVVKDYFEKSGAIDHETALRA